MRILSEHMKGPCRSQYPHLILKVWPHEPLPHAGWLWACWWAQWLDTFFVLSISRDGDDTVSLGKLCWCSINLRVKISSLHSYTVPWRIFLLWWFGWVYILRKIFWPWEYKAWSTTELILHWPEYMNLLRKCKADVWWYKIKTIQSLVLKMKGNPEFWYLFV